MTKIARLVTHSGAFHADDVFAGALLGTLFTMRIERTRDAGIIDAAGSDTLIFDVGNIYDPEIGRFDHHQPDKPLREDGLAFSAFGLIWKHYGKAYIRNILDQTKAFTGDDQSTREEAINDIHDQLDRNFVRYIDAVDNGQIMPGQEGVTHPMSITSLIMDLRPVFDEEDPDLMDQHYLEAVKTCSVFLAAKVKQQAANLRSRKIVEKAMANRTDTRWIELPHSMDYQGPILAAGESASDILFVINPSRGEWQLNVVNVAHGSYEARKQLPEAWAGLRDAALAEATGVNDAIFSHTGRFFACAKSRDGIMRLLQQALKD